MRAFALVLFALAGCAAPIVSLATPAVAPPAKEYVDVLKKWTRHGQLQSDFEETLAVDATFLSPEFQAAYAEKYVTVYKMLPEEAQLKRAEITGTAADQYSFHLESSAHHWQMNELSSTKTVWRMSILDDKGHVVSSSDLRLVKAAREFEAAFFPFQTPFSKSWMVRFPRTLTDGTPLIGPDTKSLTLRIAGPQGTIDLVWKLGTGTTPSNN